MNISIYVFVYVDLLFPN